MTKIKTKKSRRSQDWPPEEKMAAVVDAATLADEVPGAFLRRKGRAMVETLSRPASRKARVSPEKRRVKELANKLSAADRERFLEVAKSPEYRDVAPKQIVPRLAEHGIYLASEATVYRLLREEAS